MKQFLRAGLTLIEILIALTMTLIVLGAMMAAFSYASNEMASGRALIELASRARGAEDLLRDDLANVTADPRPYAQTVDPNGYVEVVEGPVDDETNLASANSSYLGDVDDILAMTVRRTDHPYRGRYNGGSIQSPLAEVIWYTTQDDSDGNLATIGFEESIRLHRRVLLIRPTLDPNGNGPGVLLRDVPPNAINNYFAINDISARVVPKGGGLFDLIANDLTDLARRENRYCHQPGAFPNILDRSLLFVRSIPKDTVLTDVCAFDVKVYSPNAVVGIVNEMVIEPGDPSYTTLPGTTPTAIAGAYVDLGFGVGPNGPPPVWFRNAPQLPSRCRYPFMLQDGTPTASFDIAFDTWTPSYESDGIDQNGNGVADEGTNGIDDDNANGVDDTAERETLPPYPYPIRGIQVSIRMIEKGSKEVYQTTVQHSFVPE